jgi:hypothetical protein
MTMLSLSNFLQENICVDLTPWHRISPPDICSPLLQVAVELGLKASFINTCWELNTCFLMTSFLATQASKDDAYSS